jgi:hypothetical protein
MAKAVRAKLVTPVGVAVYPRLNKPDTKFDNEGVYKVTLRLDPNDADVAAMVAKMEAFMAENGLAGKANGMKDEADDNGVPTGMLLMNFKVKAMWPDGTSRKPAIVDAGKQPTEANVGGGSLIRISGEMSTYDGFGGGISLSPKAIQVVKLVTWNAGVDDFDMEGDSLAAPEMQGDDEPEF